MIDAYIGRLAAYGVRTGLIEETDRIYTRNRLLELFGLEDYEEQPDEDAGAAGCETESMETKADGEERLAGEELAEILEGMLDYAWKAGLLAENTVVYRDLFDTKIMGLLTPRPSEVISQFYRLYEEDPALATDYFYRLCKDCDYIRRYRVCRDRKWKAETRYGELDITINLSKPEKDPKAIAAARQKKQSGYPKCQLCRENEGYAGRLNHPARQNHRIIPIRIQNSDWGFQYSPYVYYNEHCIVLNAVHTPMKIDRSTFAKLFDFVTQFPHYFVGSNADLPIVGGSILTHDHFQGGHYTFAMAKAPVEREVVFAGFEDVKAGIVKWPMSVIRLSGPDTERIISLADRILGCWRGYTDEAAFIYAWSGRDGSLLGADSREEKGEPHNTITPIARKNGENYELDLVLRNNVTTAEHPLGVYHPHQELHHIKKENIGLIEVMGLAVLPARLEKEMRILADAILSGREIRLDERIEKHADWVEEFLPRYDKVDRDTIDEILQKEIGIVFTRVLEHAGVYKRNEEGRRAFERFIDFVNA